MTSTVSKPKLKESYKKERTLGPIFTGGAVRISRNGQTLYSTLDEEVVVLDVHSGKPIHRLNGEADTVTAIAVQPDGKVLISAHRSLQIIAWDLDKGTKLRNWKGHEAPALVMDVDETSTVVATGSADSTVKVWDIAGAYCTHNFKGHRGVVSAIKFLGLTLFSGGEDGTIRIWDLHKRACAAVLSNHVSVVRGLDFADERTLLSASRDKVVCVWDIPSRKTKRIIPVFETLEAVQYLGNRKFATAGEKGSIKVYDLDGEKPERDLQVASKDHAISDLLYARDCGLLSAVTSDQNIILYDPDNDWAKAKQIVGHNDEIIDVCFAGPEERFLAVATNSAEIKLFDTETFDCELVAGHEGVVFCLAASKDGQFLATGSKDNTARVWRVDLDDEGRPAPRCLASLVGHAQAVGAVAVSRRSNSFVVTGSQDRTVKLWDVAKVAAGSDEADDDAAPVTLRAKFTVKAHDKDINAVAVAPNDRLFATASQDKTAKVWSTEDGSLVGTCKGHKRGVWRCAFSSVDQVLATSSGDKTVRLWNLKDFTCLRTFEGHTHSVLNVSFVSFGTQLLSSGSDGLVKLWTIKTNECVETLDAHEDRVWALTSNKSENMLITGGADSVINFWRDSTVEDQEERLKKEQDLILKEQDLANYLVKRDYKNAILLALSLNKPFRLLNIVRETMRDRTDADSATGSAAVDAVLAALPLGQVEILLGYARDWNTHAKSATAAHAVLQAVLRGHSLDSLLQVAEIKPLAEALLAYSERHVARLDDLLTQSYLLEYTLHAMDLLAPFGGDGDAGDVAMDDDDDASSSSGHEAEDRAVVDGDEAMVVTANGKRKKAA
ncbi:hypothetical protein AMAG_01526 [Allomyces macrogynus ATCC 38327]|uniref:U3 small nucleolar RNA-associated protein 13 C-terminal domain-containing protein n=1 Tax=Allomyces macrogynus (strain ATCC 38327) TaxID=578462 RepID=A0A0L0RZT0_ALLM3|nr:hypothetical protein AMAG_01526 [Allomyces macrogynus ATCC 38327]|eukprot:KNE55640.1 hypothetical protein AMAG_01526 [Allomyces macrogynus ATCC 38327]